MEGESEGGWQYINSEGSNISRSLLPTMTARLTSVVTKQASYSRSKVKVNGYILG